MLGPIYLFADWCATVFEEQIASNSMIFCYDLIEKVAPPKVPQVEGVRNRREPHKVLIAFFDTCLFFTPAMGCASIVWSWTNELQIFQNVFLMEIYVMTVGSLM